MRILLLARPDLNRQVLQIGQWRILNEFIDLGLFEFRADDRVGAVGQVDNSIYAVVHQIDLLEHDFGFSHGHRCFLCGWCKEFSI